MNIHRFLAALIATPVLTWHQSSLAQNSQPDLNQKLALYAKPAVVRVVSQCSGTYLWKGSKSYPNQRFDPNLDFIGTGFFINPNGYIVTSAGVLANKKDCEDRIYDNVSQSIQNKYKFGNPLSRKEVQKQGDLKVSFSPGLVILPNNTNFEPLPFEVKKLGRALGQEVEVGEDVAIIKVALKNAPTLKLGDSSQVKIQDHILTIGYPTSADMEGALFESSVQEGVISNPYKQLEGTPVLQIDIQAGKGSAGSPLINDQGEVIGMLTNELALAIPTSTIWEFIRQSGATNKRGVTDKYYRGGLLSLWLGNYEEAKVNFLKVKELFPLHSEINKLILQIDEILADRYVKPWKNPTYQLLLALVVGGGVIAVVAYFSPRILRRILIILRQKLSSLGSRIFKQIQKRIQELNEQPISYNLIKARAEEIWKARVEKGLNDENPEADWYTAIDSLKLWHLRLKLRLKITAKKIWLWSGISDKKGWDLLTAISLPLVLFLGAQYFALNSANEQKKIADRRYRQDLLEKYFSQISELIFKKSQDKKTLTVIRAKTLSVLNEFNEDGESKGLILGFLVDSRMIVVSEQQEPVDISHANFGDANLTDANLMRAQLNKVKLTDANLTDANLTDANLNRTILTGADLTGADLTGADLTGADLTGADLTGAILTRANLRGADLTRANLKEADFTGAILIGVTLTPEQVKQAKNPQEVEARLKQMGL